MNPEAATNGTALTLQWPDRDVAQVTFTRPDAMNTLSLELIDELETAQRTVAAHAPRALVITGSGRAFCCGAHLRYFTEGDARIGRSPRAIRDRYLARIATVFDQLEELPFPTIAAINGYALGGGFELALSCDFRVMARDAKAGLPETRIGAIPGAGGVQKLHRFIGRGKALEWILLGEHLEARTLFDHGLLTRVCEPGEAVAAALELAGRFRALSPMAVAQAKRSLYACEQSDARSARITGIEALANLIDTPDWREGMTAFVEKRDPDFKT